MRYLAILVVLALVGGCSADDTPSANEANEANAEDRHLLQDQQDALEKAKAAAAALESSARRTEEALEQD